MSTSEANDSPEEPREICPYWHQVSADFAAMYPGEGYCTAGCHKRVKVMAGKTLEELCILRYGECEGYQRVLAAEQAKALQNPGSTRQ